MSKSLRDIAREIRKRVVRMHRIGPNMGSSMSQAEILATLYFEAMSIDAPDDPARDRFILSKGHAASSLYATLALKGFIDESLLDTYMQNDSPLTGHPVRGAIPGIEVSSGSLGHGLPIGAGIALAARCDGRSFRTFVVIGDGECQEGSVWEGAMVAARLGLDKLTVIVDANQIQGFARTEEILPRSSLMGIFKAFGWATVEVDGHDTDALTETFARLPFESGRPSAVIAYTIKGKGIKKLEDTLGSHYYSVKPEQLEPYLAELDASADATNSPAETNDSVAPTGGSDKDGGK